MPRPKGRETSPQQLLTMWLDYAVKCKKGHHQPTLTGERGFVRETGKHKDTIISLIKSFGLGPPPLVFPGGFTFLLEPEPPHDIIWTSDETYDLQDRATYDLRPHVGRNWPGYLISTIDYQRVPAELSLRRGFDAVDFLTLKVQPVDQPSLINKIVHGAAGLPHRIKPLSVLFAERQLVLTPDHMTIEPKDVDMEARRLVATDYRIAGDLRQTLYRFRHRQTVSGRHGTGKSALFLDRLLKGDQGNDDSV